MTMSKTLRLTFYREYETCNNFGIFIVMQSHKFCDGNYWLQKSETSFKIEFQNVFHFRSPRLGPFHFQNYGQVSLRRINC